MSSTSKILKEMSHIAHKLQRATSCASQDDYISGMSFEARNAQARADIEPLLAQLNQLHKQVKQSEVDA
jgi:hypothetical protein